jgi:phage N-6-adenine-methyltransferase
VTKMDVHYSSKTDLWATPQDFFNELHQEFSFTLDVCALPENAKCDRYFTPEMDGLDQEWKGICWMNPPYGREIGKWVKKAYEASKEGVTVVCLLPARTDTRWFHDYIYGKAEIRFIKGRLRFGGATENAPFPNMVVVFKATPKIKQFTQEWLSKLWQKERK